ncbi:hypothetical protein SASPL_116765 [Salvia splendens]|uniref:Uncharacterized protein n=1 Tax=Salvia splendens TaxID=180675 RepID=A0A8X8XYE9_SALSN|nr:hypothetical protein SASPL_116765 [Salvia splendens]
MIIPQQNAFFYKGRWNPRMDELVLDTAIRMRCDNPWPEDNIPDTVAYEAGATIERELGVHLMPIEVSQRLMVMYARYLTFKDVVTTTGTCWVPDMQVVVADYTVWQKIIKTHPFAAAYYHRDEPEYEKLCVLFDPAVGDPHGQQLHPEEPIVISDTVEVVSAIPAQPVEVVSALPAQTVPVVIDLDEVTSPTPQTPKVVRRKLFTESSPGTESTNGLPNPYVTSSPNGAQLRTISNSKTRHPLWGNNNLLSSPVQLFILGDGCGYEAFNVSDVLFMNSVRFGAEFDQERVELLLSQVAGKDITELIAGGREKLASVPSGGGAIACK